MNNGMMGKAMLITWASLGVQVDRFDDTDDGVIFLFTVPQSSYERGADGEEMSGKHLASRVKTTLEKMGMKFADIRYGIRDEYWDKTKAENAQKAVYKDLGYSKWQYEKEGL